MDQKAVKFWALYYHVLSEMKKGLTLAKASVVYVGEELEAAKFFHSYLNS